MLQLLMLLLILVGIYAVLTIFRIGTPNLRGRISLALFFIFTGIGHFFLTEKMIQMLPASIPMRKEIIYITGVLEILGALGLLIPKFTRPAAIALILFLIGVLPANIYSAFQNLEFGGHQLGPVYLLARVPFQLFVIIWTYYFGIRTFPITQVVDKSIP
jgi:uncharacterized membrane protein